MEISDKAKIRFWDKVNKTSYLETYLGGVGTKNVLAGLVVDYH